MNININNGTLVRLQVNDDANKVLEFDPFDISFINGLYKIIETFEKFKDYNSFDELEKKFEEVDDLINKLFGANATKYLFDNRHNISAYKQFFTQIKPYIEEKRQVFVNQYIN